MSRSIYIGIAFLMVPFLCYAQKESKIRSVSKVSSDVYLQIDSARIYENQNPTKSFDFIEKALTNSLETRNKNGEALSYQSLGRINFNLNQFDLAIDYYFKALHIFESLNNQDEIHNTYWLLANAYQQINDYENALIYYKNFLQYVEKQKNTDEIVRAKNNMAEIYNKTGKSKEALTLLNDVLETEKKRNNPSGAIEAQNYIGQVYQESNKDMQALEFYEQSANLAEEVNDKEALKKSLQNQGSVLRKSKRYDDELQVRQQLLSINKEFDAKPEQAEDNLEIGNIFIEKNETEKAIPYIQRSIELSEETGSLEKKGKALQTLSTAYDKQKDYDKALETYREYVATVDELYKKRESEIKTSLQITASLNRKLERLDLIEKELSLSQKTVNLLRQEQLVNRKELRAQQIFTYSLLIAFVVLAVASFFVYRSGIHKRKSNQLLELKSLRSQMNPHFIYNSLNSVNSYISKNDERAANKYLAEFSRLMRSVMENSKHDFVPLNSEIEILKLYLSLEYSRFSDKFDYDFTVDPGIETESCFVPPMLVQPFIENAIWHGLRYREEKGFLSVTLKQNNQFIEVSIEDNGIGRKKSTEIKTKFQKEHHSTGLQNIETRVQVIKELYKINLDIHIEDIDSKSGEGTKVLIKIPKNHKID